MTTIDWRRKLTSRKFWVAVAQFVSMLIIALKGTEETATQVTALIMAGAAVIAYIIGEGLTDASAAKASVTIVHEGEVEDYEPPEEEPEESEEKADE